MQDQSVVNIFKGLVIDSVNKSQSGHPGGAMSSMDATYILFSEFLKFNPKDPKWAGRDRFILSAGHMSMLQYTMLYGIGWLSMDDLKNFRQLHAKTPGHPENYVTPGVECTTGPLGQGCAMSLGFAVASKHLASKIDQELFNYKTWVVCSDGDLQECVALSSASLAGHLKLDNLIWVYDKNHIQLSGPTKKCISDNDQTVFEGFGWHVIAIDGHDHAAIRRAYQEARQVKGKPTLVICNTVMGKGCATLENTAKTHGSPLPSDERIQTKLNLGLPSDQDFYVTESAISHFRRNFGKRADEVATWDNRLKEKLKNADFKKAWDSYFAKVSASSLPAVPWDLQKEIPTRNAFGDIIKHWAHALPNLFGGSADLEPSNMTGGFAKAVSDFDGEARSGRNVNFGVREFSMAALCNGMALHGGFIPFDATFLSFADYSRGAIRLGALQKVRVIHEFTHDSFYLGEDGPTHQPVEHVMSLRVIPNLYVMRPACPLETEVLMRVAVDLELPSAFCLTRQKVSYVPGGKSVAEGAKKGAYVVADAADPNLIIIATGSEVGLALKASANLKGYRVRVVSMPCWELFAEQPKTYQEQVLPKHITKRVSIEAGTTLGWAKFVGLDGLTIGLDHFGESAPANVLEELYGFTPAKICESITKHFG